MKPYRIHDLELKIAHQERIVLSVQKMAERGDAPGWKSRQLEDRLKQELRILDAMKRTLERNTQ